MVDSLLFVHADTGCDTTSAVYCKCKCKRLPFRKLQAQPALCTAVQVFNDPRESRDDIAAAGEAFLCVVYGRKIDNYLNVKSHHLYMRTIAKQKVCAKFDLATLSPTSTLVLSVPPSAAVAWCRIESYRLGMDAERWTPDTTPCTRRTSTRDITPSHNVQLQIGL